MPLLNDRPSVRGTGFVGDDRHAAPRSRPSSSRRVSPARGGSPSPPAMTASLIYPASASRETPYATPTRSQSTQQMLESRTLQNTQPRHGGATPLSVRELNTGPAAAARCGVRAGAAASGSSAQRHGAGAGRGQPASTIRGAAGALYAVRVSPHPLHTKNAHVDAHHTAGHRASRRPQSSSPTPRSARLDPHGALMISSANNTVRGLRGAATPTPSAAAPPPAPTSHLHGGRRRQSLIERVASVVGVEGTSAAATHDPSSPLSGAAAATTQRVHFQLPLSADGDAAEEGQRVLSPLPSREAMKMHLRPTPSNVVGESALVKRLDNDAVVTAAAHQPEKAATKEKGPESEMYAQLSAFKMPSDAAPGAPPPPPSSAAAAAAAGVAGADGNAAGPVPPAAPAAPPAAPAAAETAGQPSAPPPPSLPVLHATAREATSEEKAAAEAERLVDELLAQAQRRRGQSGAGFVSTPHAQGYVETLSAAAAGGSAAAWGADARFAAFAVQQQQQRAAGLYGWQRPPANVVLPDPSQPEATWTLLGSTAEQQAQQTAAAQAIVHVKESPKNVADASDGVSARTTTYGAADAREGPSRAATDAAAAAAVWCADYHAPFQRVLHPETLEKAEALPNSVGAAVDEAEDAAAIGSGDRSARDADGATVKSFASQAVLLRDPLSLLACEHLAEDTVEMVARRRAYVTAMTQLGDSLRGAGLPPHKDRPSSLHSVLQPAAPPGEVFCELSYQAKVLLSAVLYMRALGALPTLLRVGPLTEYSAIVDKENCIELVFYNPSDEERKKQETQEAQQEQQRRHTLQRRQQSLQPRVSVAGQPAVRSNSATLPFATAATNNAAAATAAFSTARGRAQSQQPYTTRSRGESPEVRSGSPPQRRPSRSQSATNAAAARPGGAAEEPRDRVYAETGISPSRRSPPRHTFGSSSDGRGGDATMQRRHSAVETLLMQSLTTVAQRRSSSSVLLGAESPAPLPVKAEGSIAVTSKGMFAGASLTSLAGPLLRSAEPSFLGDEMTDAGGGSPTLSSHRRPTFPGTEAGGSWLQRSPAGEAAARVHLPRYSITTAADGHGSASTTADGSAPLRQRRGSECDSGVGVAGVPHVPGERRGTAAATRPTSAASFRFVSAGGAPRSTSPSLRRSSVRFALEDKKQAAPAEADSAAKGQPGSSAPRVSLVPTPAAFRPSVQFDTTLDIVAAPTRNGSEVEPPKPVSPRSGGNPRFPDGERELCVVLRAVVAQKSTVYSFGKSETVHVLPPLPPRSAVDDADESTLLKRQVERKRTDLARLSVDSTNPLLKFLGGAMRRSVAVGAAGDDRDGETADGATIEEVQRRVSLRERARRMTVTARQQGPVAVDAQGRPKGDDYGDLVVAFVLSRGASELSGSAPDMMELESLRYRIFSLHGYNTADPSGMQAVRAAAAASGAVGAASRGEGTAPGQSPGADARSTSFTAASWGSARGGSPLESGQNRLQRQLSSYTAFQSVTADPRHVSPETSIAVDAPVSPARAATRGTQRRSSFFESALRKTDPVYGGQRSGDADGGDYVTEFDMREHKAKLQQQRDAALQARYPIYRASSVAESTLEAFAAEAKASVAAGRRRQRTAGGHAAESVDGAGRVAAGGGSSPSDSLRELLNGSRSPVRAGRVSDSADATALLQEAERDLLRFRPMNMNSFHRELTEAVQYSLDLQARLRAEKGLQAFHM